MIHQETLRSSRRDPSVPTTVLYVALPHRAEGNRASPESPLEEAERSGVSNCHGHFAARYHAGMSGERHMKCMSAAIVTGCSILAFAVASLGGRATLGIVGMFAAVVVGLPAAWIWMLAIFEKL